MEQLVRSIQSSKAIRHAMDEATEHVEKAIDSIKPFHKSVEHEALLGLAHYIVDRTF